MKSKLFIVIMILCLLGGLFTAVINDYYPLDYLFNIILNRGLQVNPRAEIDPEKKYTIQIWYYPFFRTTGADLDMEKIFKEIEGDINTQYPNFNLVFKKLSFLNGHEEFINSADKGNPPDIYFNISDNICLDKKYQIPVEWYIGEEEKDGICAAAWNNIGGDRHLWGFPFLVEELAWVANINLNDKFYSEKYLFNIENLENKKLYLNIHDTTLLRQLLSFKGIKNFEVIENGAGENTRNKIIDLFRYLHKLREEDIIMSSVNNSLVRMLIKDKNIIAGPVNPWLCLFLDKKKIIKTKFTPGNKIKIYSLNIFRQKDYRGDDHTKAVMEVAKYISENYSARVAEKLNLNPGYSVPGSLNRDSNKKFVQILQFTPSEQRYWQEVITPVWIDFWEKELTVEEVMDRLEEFS